jgi:hypothetical protein
MTTRQIIRHIAAVSPTLLIFQRPMFRRYLFKQNVVTSPLQPLTIMTGQLANTTKIGRFAKVIRSEIVVKHQRMNLVVFGDYLIGKSVKAMCIAREGFQENSMDSQNPIPILSFLPTIIDSPEKTRANVVSVEILISSCDKHPEPRHRPIHMNISSKLDHEELAKKLHTLYLNGSVDSFVLRCMGYLSSATVVKALGLFNQKVVSQKLHASIRTEPVPSKYLRREPNSVGESLRAIVFEIVVLAQPSD